VTPATAKWPAGGQTLVASCLGPKTWWGGELFRSEDRGEMRRGRHRPDLAVNRAYIPVEMSSTSRISCPGDPRTAIRFDRFGGATGPMQVLREFFLAARGPWPVRTTAVTAGPLLTPTALLVWQSKTPSAPGLVIGQHEAVHAHLTSHANHRHNPAVGHIPWRWTLRRSVSRSNITRSGKIAHAVSSPTRSLAVWRHCANRQCQSL
jgi:hypothetical protein